jgi:K+ transporter
MMKRVILIGIGLLVGLVAAKAFGLHNAKSKLATKVERQLALVDDKSGPAVKERLIQEAAQVGIQLKPANIQVGYEDAGNVQSVAQKLVGKTGLQFQNKRVSIKVRYTASLLGLPWQQEISQSVVRQISVTAPNRMPEM